MKLLVRIYILMTFFLSISSLAVGNPVVSGTGTISCEKWFEGRAFKNKEMDAFFASWIQGFLSGMNTQRYIESQQAMSELPDIPTMLAYVDKECSGKPLQKIYPILVNLYQDIQKNDTKT